MAATWRVSDLIAQLQPDPWRANHRFSADILQCHDVLFNPVSSRGEKTAALSHWLAESQPCLFGKMEARQRRLAFCLLTENDLERSDQEIRARIEQERTRWKRTALAGNSHGFVIVAIARGIANALPGPALHQLAGAVCGLYLGVDTSDAIHHDDLILGTRLDGKTEFRRWRVGVNYFSAQGDGRWWHDHRIPGGMAFSMNSVGHMARSLAERELHKKPELAIRCAEVPRNKLVYWALRIAMKTIGPPEPGGTRGTWLVKRGTFPEDIEPPTYEERTRYFEDLAQFSENRYKGLYHTDITIPSEYFDEGLWRLDEIGERDNLYFTYLHSPADEDYVSMGLGAEIGAELGEAELNQARDRSEQ